MNFKKFYNKLLTFFILISIIIIPTNAFAYSKKVVVGGDNIGIEINSNGVLIVGFYTVNNASPGKDASLEIGDRIVKIDDTVISTITDLSKATNTNNDTISITYIRNNKEQTTNLKLYQENGIYKTGLYVKDTIIGIGTLTFIDPNTKIFGALGHEILETTTKEKFEIKAGSIFSSSITGISKATRNSPGEKNASYNINKKYGVITRNDVTGIYGTYNKEVSNNLIEVAENSEITLGKAYIKTVISSNKVEDFEIEILQINPDTKTKNILFKVTDQTLLEKTGGIVQGMSGSPIIQNDKLVGAVTHVISDDATKGFGIFITTMLKESEN